jgi:hypothetical protein
MEIDGVTTFWEEGPGPLTGMLVFGVGARHESFRTIGIAHVVEHLVMDTLPRSHLDVDATVDIDTTTFSATGRPDQVADFIGRICTALRDLPLDRLQHEAGVLEAESSTAEHPAACWSLGVRYGFTGPGVLSTSGPGPSHLTPEQVRDFAATHFVRGNAVLVLTGPPPLGLRLDLPEGRRPHLDAGRRTPIPLPALIRHDMPFPSLSVELAGHEAHRSVLPAIMCERLFDDLRRTRGIAYSCEFRNLWLGHTAVVTVWSDGHADKLGTVASTMWSTLRELATAGPTRAELDHEVARIGAAFDDPRSTGTWLESSAWWHLHGLPVLSRAEYLETLRSLDRDTVRTWAEEGLRTALVGLPEDVEVELDGLPDRTDEHLPTADPVEGERFGRKVLSISPLDLHVVVGQTGISQTCFKHTVTTPWNRVVGVATANGVRSLVLDTGQGILLTRRHLRNADRLFEIIDDKLCHLMFEKPLEEILDS